MQEFDGLKYRIMAGEIRDDDTEDEETLPDEPSTFRDDYASTAEELEAKSIYETAMALLNKTKPNKMEAYELLQEAASKGNYDAKALVAWAMLIGNPLQQNIDEAKATFETLAEIGHPEGHTALGRSNLRLNLTLILFFFLKGSFTRPDWALT